VKTIDFRGVPAEALAGTAPVIVDEESAAEEIAASAAFCAAVQIDGTWTLVRRSEPYRCPSNRSCRRYCEGVQRC